MNFLAMVITGLLVGIVIGVISPALPVWQMILLCICTGILVQRVWYWLTWPR